MGDFKGTKGKWESKGATDKFDFYVVCGGKVISYMPRSKAEDEANSKLIAAAPELLDALQSIVEYWDNPQKGSLNNHIEHSLKIAEAVIKKATE